MRDRKLMTPHEAEIDRMVQIMACLIDKLGGEVFVSRQELQSFFDVPVVTRVISEDYVRLSLKYPEEEEVETSTELPEEPPQT